MSTHQFIINVETKEIRILFQKKRKTLATPEGPITGGVVALGP